MRVFITICTSDSYVPGVLALNRSLKAVESRYPLYLLTTSQLSDTSLTQIKGEGIEVLFDAPITPGAYVRHQNEINGSPNWNNTFFKLRIFGLTQFDKLIYLDSDMIVAANIDYLFDKPHMSAVAAGRGFNPTWRQLNSGLMVIEPDRQMMDDLLGAGTVRLSAWEMEEFDREYTKIDLMGHRADPFTESQIDK